MPQRIYRAVTDLSMMPDVMEKIRLDLSRLGYDVHPGENGSLTVHFTEGTARFTPHDSVVVLQIDYHGGA
jgi:hypothetical protein